MTQREIVENLDLYRKDIQAIWSLKGTNTLHPKREIRNKQKEEYDKDAFSHLFLFNLYSKIILKG